KNSLLFLSHTGAVSRDDEFWSIPDRAVNFVRHRRNAALPLRKAAMIAPAEYRLAIRTAIDEAVALSRDELIVETARLFRFDRTGSDLKQEIERQVNALIRASAIVDDGDRLRTNRNGAGLSLPKGSDTTALRH